MIAFKQASALYVVFALSTAALGCGSNDGSDMGSPAGTGAGGQATGGAQTGGGSSAGALAGGGSGAGTGGAAAGTGGAGGGGGSGGGTATGCVVSETDDAQPLLLSQTGCIDMAHPAQPAPGLVPYSVRSALWSDGASKERFLRLPAGMKIHVLDCAAEPMLCTDPGMGGNGEDDGHWDMPVGTVLVKNFSIEDKHIETRLLMRRSSISWKGFSYEWNDAQTEATLLPDDGEGKDKPVGTAQPQQVWHYPSRTQCLTCHTKYAGRSLGPSTQQLNSDFAYADGSMNQVEKFKALGLFDAPPKTIAGYPDPKGADTLDLRARSYIQTNCAICHRPGGEFNSVDLRFTTSFDMTNLCGKVERATGIVPDYRLVPGDPAKSTMSFRMHVKPDPAQPLLRMPQIGSNMVDPDGTKLIDDWITAMPANACPPQP
jgi:uncharacterized repeat protein (TIGR03806 family)